MVLQEDETNLEPAIQNFDCLMPCMEQHLKLEASKLTHANDDLILMMYHYHEQDIDEKSILEIAEEKPRSYDESRLEQDGENIQQNEKEQMEDDIMHQINSSTDEIIASFENLSVEESDNDNQSYGTPDEKIYSEMFRQSIDHFYHGTHESEQEDIDENTDTDDGVNDDIDLENTRPDIIIRLQRQDETIKRLRLRIERLNEAMDEILTYGTDPRCYRTTDDTTD
jgi:hypothetical protein